ncbi:MAG: phage antirepressor N-terminal domain-containing protein [Fusobacteriales bacterium]|jgi:hypothetical protein|nr:phage antirepressor N-terminal domain-containing protein [Fusobacteriales bacterium]
MKYLEKVIEFHGDNLLTLRDEETGEIYVSVKHICNSMKMEHEQYRTQKNKINKDIFLKGGTKLCPLETNGGIQQVLMIELDYLPAWLFKINPARFEEKLKEKLFDYQLHCKDILADAFFGKRPQKKVEEPKYGTDINEIEVREKMIREDTDTIRNLMLRIAYNYKRIGKRSMTGFEKIKESYKNLKRTGFVEKDNTWSIEEIDSKNEFGKEMLLKELEE